MGVAVGIVSLTVAVVPGVAAPLAPPSTVSCEPIIAQVRSGHGAGRRVVLGVVSVPPAYSWQGAFPTGRRPWPYFRKAGMVIRAGSPPVTVTVPNAWRRRVMIGWGDGGGSSVQFASCEAYGPKRWNAWSGGFHLRSPSACVPLVFQVGRRTATVRFGIGRRCR